MKKLIMLLTILSLSVIGCKGKDKIEYYCQKEELEEIKIQIPDTMIDINKLPEKYERKVLIEMKFGDGEGEMGLGRISSTYDGGPFDIMGNGDIVIIDGNNNRVLMFNRNGEYKKCFDIDTTENILEDTIEIEGDKIILSSITQGTYNEINRTVINTSDGNITTKKDEKETIKLREEQNKSAKERMLESEKKVNVINLNKEEMINDNKKLFSKIRDYAKEYNLGGISKKMLDNKGNLYMKWSLKMINDTVEIEKNDKFRIVKIDPQGNVRSIFKYEPNISFSQIDKDENVYIYKIDIIWTGDPYDNPSDLYKSLDREKSRVYIIKYELKK